MAKNFKDAAAKAQPVYNTLIGNTPKEQDAQEVQETHNVQEVHEVSNTQTHKGAKSARMNMAFTQDHMEYLRVMSSIKGESMTNYVNNLIAQDLEKNKETYQAIKSLAEKI